MQSVAVGGWQIDVSAEPPTILDRYVERAEHVERLAAREWDGYVFAAISDPEDEWPSLVITGPFSPASGFTPGVLVVPEMRRVFFGAGSQVLVFHRVATGWRRERIREVSVGFWGWRRHGDIVVMLEELELAGWSVEGEQLWTTFVEPPWNYTVSGDRVRLDVMGRITEFPLASGPSGR